MEIPDLHRPPNEEAHHNAAVCWLKRHQGLEVRFEDADEATKATLDLVGLLRGRPLFLESKRRFIASWIPDIERKLSNALRGHADLQNEHPLFVVMRDVWDGASAPLFVVLAPGFVPEALRGLREMLMVRAAEWAVDCEIWEWTGARVEERARIPSGANGVRDPDLQIEKIPGPPSNRGPAATLEALREEARDRGVLSLFDRALDAADAASLRREPQRRAIGFQRRRGVGLLRVLPGESDAERGLVLDATRETLEAVEEGLVEIVGSGIHDYIRIAVRTGYAVEALIEQAARAGR